MRWRPRLLPNGTLTRADQEVLDAIELNPKYAEAHEVRAKILQALNRHQEAIASKKISDGTRSLQTLGSYTASFLLLARRYDAALTRRTATASYPRPDDPRFTRFPGHIGAKVWKKKPFRGWGSILLLRRQASAESSTRGPSKGRLKAAVHWQIGDKSQRPRSTMSRLRRGRLYAQLGDAKRRSPFWKKLSAAFSLYARIQSTLPTTSCTPIRVIAPHPAIGLPPAW